MTRRSKVRSLSPEAERRQEHALQRIENIVRTHPEVDVIERGELLLVIRSLDRRS